MSSRENAATLRSRKSRSTVTEEGTTGGQRLQAPKMRPDFLAKDGYLSREWVQLEKAKLWPRVWQIACRVEELKNVGDYVTYDIADDSIIIVRTGADKLQAFHNVCQHRGRQLVTGCGHVSRFHCRFHGWQWNIDGSLARIIDRADWGDDCPEFTDEDLRLPEVKLDTWAGFVFINMDPNCEPLQEFLQPMPQYLDCYEFDKWRYRWYKTTVLPCNWKAALEGFNESYHVQATHPQLLARQGDDYTIAKAMGRHGMYYYPASGRPIGAPSSRTGRPIPDDLRPTIVEFYNEMNETLRAMFSPRSVEATHRLLSEVEPSNDPAKVHTALMEFHKQAAIASGAGWPNITPTQQFEGGINWHLFPNHVFLMLPDASIAYRARPNGDDPDTCIFDIWSLQRYAPGAEPPLKREFIPDWTANTVEDFGLILSQDFQNFGLVQRGMKSRGFRGSRINPIQELEITNMHRALYEYLFD